jgi:hypothetical protein
MKDVECPYCGIEQDIDHSDNYGFNEGKLYEQECQSCGQTFLFEAFVSYSYEVSKK